MEVTLSQQLGGHDFFFRVFVAVGAAEGLCKKTFEP